MMEKVLPKHYNLLKPFFEHQPYKLSAFCLPMLFEWQDIEDYEIRFAIENGVLIQGAINHSDPTSSHLGLPLPSDGFDPKALAQLAKRNDFNNYWNVPVQYLEQYSSDEIEKYFIVNEQKHFCDYIYSTSDLAELDGRPYAKKRNLIRQFEKEYGDDGRILIETIDSSKIDECLSFVEEWCEEQGCTSGQSRLLACDKEATIKALSLFDLLEFDGLLVRVDGKVVGIGAAIRLTEKMGVLNIEKAFAKYKGLYQLLDRECARRLFSGKYDFINKESDMGVAGLAQAKRSYYPAERIQAFHLLLRDR